MFYMVEVTNTQGISYLYIIKATSLQRALEIIGENRDNVNCCSITKDILDALSIITEGYAELEF